MKACVNCGAKIKEDTEICPNCGAVLHEDEELTGLDTEVQEDIIEEAALDGPLDLNEAIDNLPDEVFLDDEIEKHELEIERRKFNKSTE